MVLVGVSLRGDVRGGTFETRLEQKFVNPGPEALEVVYTFPLPWGAEVLEVEARLGDRYLSGAVVGKKEAEARYEDAIAGGDAAIMVERNRDGSYCINLGNLSAGEACSVRLRYAQVLQIEQGGVRLLIPTVIAPRYGDAVADGGLRPHQAPEHSLTASYPFELEITLHGELARGAVSSPSHLTRSRVTAVGADTSLTISLSRKGFLDRDFILIVQDIPHQSLAIQAKDFVEEGKVAILASFCPRIAAREPQSVATKILVDCSGSMAGDSIAASRRALQSVIGQLTTGDRFSLSRFGSTVEHRCRGLWTLTDATRLSGQRWINNLNADLGGTEMETALQSTFDLPGDDSCDLLLITDGEISAIDSTIRRAQDSRHRLFVVGIGSSPAEIHLRRLAEATGGACDFVAPGETVEPAILRMFHRLRSPRLSSLSLRWPDGATPVWEAPLPMAVFDGDTLNLFAFFDRPLQGRVTLQGVWSGREKAEEIGAAIIQGNALNADMLSRLAAAERVKTAEDPQGLAVSYQLLTSDTNFLMVHIRDQSDKVTDMPDLHVVRQMIPAGWGGMGSVCTDSCMELSSFDYDLDMPRFLRRMPADEWESVSQSGSAEFSKSFHSRDVVIVDEDEHETQAPVATVPDQPQVSPKVSLSPRELQDRLRRIPVDQWPTTYVGLTAMGLDQTLVEWLKQTVDARHPGRWPEGDIVRAFLQLLAGWNLLGGAVSRSSPGLLTRLRAKLGVVPAARPNATLAATLGTALAGMSGDAWPAQVAGVNS
jgi:Ca-activated chloride channel family protein